MAQKKKKTTFESKQRPLSFATTTAFRAFLRCSESISCTSCSDVLAPYYSSISDRGVRYGILSTTLRIIILEDMGVALASEIY